MPLAPQNAGSNRRVTPKPATAKSGPTRFSPAQTATWVLRLGKAQSRHAKYWAPVTKRSRRPPPAARSLSCVMAGLDPPIQAPAPNGASILSDRLTWVAGSSPAMTADRGLNKTQCVLGDGRAQRPRKLRRRISRAASRRRSGRRVGARGSEACEMNDELAQAARPGADLLALGMKRVAAQTRRGLA